MISEPTLAAALAQGVLSPDQAARLRQMEDARKAAAALEPPDEEKLRFITGFGDIFVSIGLILVFAACMNFHWRTLIPIDAPAFPPIPVYVLADVARWALIGLLSWGLAEYFTRRRRMALPSILLVLAFCWAVFRATGIALLISGLVPISRFPLDLQGPSVPAVIASACAAAVAAWLHYRRFGVPIAPALGAASLLLAGVAAVNVLAPGAAPLVIHGVLLVAGIAIFALAMRFDARDPQRVTRNTDIAFWLHLLAAPLIVHTLIGGLWHGDRAETGSAFAVLSLFLALGVVALLVNRRAILVSGLVYAGLAFGTLLYTSGARSISVDLTLLVLGAFILILSAGWQRLRRLALGVLPGRLVRFLPPLTVSAT